MQINNVHLCDECIMTTKVMNAKSQKTNFEDILFKEANRKISYEDLVKDIYKLPVSTGAKVAFKQYTESHNKDELQKLREKILYQLFNTDQAIDLAKAKESNFTVWYQYVKEILEPSILERSILEQKKILAILTKVKADAIDSNVVNNTYKEFWKRILSS